MRVADDAAKRASLTATADEVAEKETKSEFEIAV